MKTLNKNQFSPAIEEFVGVITGWRIWFTLAWNNIKLRYRRSSLGPFWITASMGVRIYFMGFLYGHLFKVNITEYFPFLASGIIAWTLINTILAEAAQTFVHQENYLRNMKILYSHLIMNCLLRNLIIFGHNILAYIPIIAYFGTYDPKFSAFNLLLIIPGGLLLILNLFLWNSIIAILGTRFRDIFSLIESLMQIIFFVTPIMWLPSLLPEKYHLAITLNPFYHLLVLIREPMLGHAIPITSFVFASLMSIVSFACFYRIMNKAKHRIIFWL